MLPSYFDHISVHERQKARLRPEIFVNSRPEPDPKSPARLTTLVLWGKISFRRGQKLLPFSTIRACWAISVAKIFD